jgi:hypothetical protein
MIAVIAGHIGRVHHALQHPALRKTRPCYAFIPEQHFSVAGFEKSRHLISRWPSINGGANPLAVGSHVVPDPENPVSIRSRCSVLKEFLTKLETIAIVKSNAA